MGGAVSLITTEVIKHHVGEEVINLIEEAGDSAKQKMQVHVEEPVTDTKLAQQDLMHDDLVIKAKAIPVAERVQQPVLTPQPIVEDIITEVSVPVVESIQKKTVVKSVEQEVKKLVEPIPDDVPKIESDIKKTAASSSSNQLKQPV